MEGEKGPSVWAGGIQESSDRGAGTLHLCLRPSLHRLLAFSLRPARGGFNPSGSDAREGRQIVLLLMPFDPCPVAGFSEAGTLTAGPCHPHTHPRHALFRKETETDQSLSALHGTPKRPAVAPLRWCRGGCASWPGWLTTLCKQSG